MLRDDDEGGHNHTHPKFGYEATGHHHDQGVPRTPFTLTGNNILTAMQEDFFDNVTYSNEDILQIAELTFGVNGNDSSNIASRSDSSATWIAERLQSGELNNQCLSRIFAAIHIATPFEIRLRLNERRLLYPPTQKEIDDGLASWGLDPYGMRIFQGDDGYALEELFREAGIPHILTIPNDGSSAFDSSLNKLLKPIVDNMETLWLSGEGNQNFSRRR